VKWGAPKEQLPRPVKSFYNDDPNLPTTDGILDSDLQQPDLGFRRKIEYSRRR